MSRDMISRRRFLQYAAGTTGALALAACTPASAPSGSAGEGGAASEEAVTLTFGRHWEAAFRPHQDEFDNLYIETHPDVEIEITYNTWADHQTVVPTWAAADTLPDVVYVHGSRAFPWAFEGITIPLQDYVDTDDEFDVGGIWDESLSLYRFQGILHGIPYDHGPIILGYNKDMFDAAGMAYPDETWTMDQLRDAARELTNPDGDIPQWGWGGNFPDLGNTGYYATVGGWGGELMSDDETQVLLDSDASREALQFWYDLIHVDNSAPTPAESDAFEQGPWIAGQVAMQPAASWNAPTWTSFATMNWDVAPLPSGPAQRITNSFGSGYSITRNSSRPDAAWEYLSEYLSEEGMIFMWGNTGRGSPARESGYLAWMESSVAPASAQYFIDALNDYAITGHPYQNINAAEFGDVQGRQTGLLRAGETDVESAIAAIVEEGQAVLDDAATRFEEKFG